MNYFVNVTVTEKIVRKVSVKFSNILLIREINDLALYVQNGLKDSLN